VVSVRCPTLVPHWKDIPTPNLLTLGVKVLQERSDPTFKLVGNHLLGRVEIKAVTTTSKGGYRVVKAC